MSDAQIGRRALLRGAGGLAALAALPSLSACGTGSSRTAGGSGGKGGKTVVVRDSGGSYGAALQKAIYTPFTQETGIQVKVLNLDDAPLLAQIKQGRPQCDLINNSMMSHTKYVKQDALEALDLDRIKSVKSAKIPENQITDHAISHAFYGQCIGYRTDAFGGRKPESWADFWDTKAFKGGRSMCNPDGDLPELEFALLADGVPMDKLYPLDVDRAFKVLTRLRGDIKKFWDSGPLPGVLLSRQEVTMSTVWDGRLADLEKRVGSPDLEDTELGPLADHRAVDKVRHLVEDAVARGAVVMGKADIPDGPGHWAAPTVLDHVPADAAIMHEEVFGPVAAIHRFSTEAEAITVANNTEHGLASYVMTSHIDRARRVAARLQAGMVGINRGLVSEVAAPFGGVKQSGLGREGGPEGLHEYQQLKYLSMPGFNT